MKTEIKKLYKNAGIEKEIECDHINCPQFGIFGRDKCAAKNCIPTEDCIKHKKYTTAKYVYPDFTPEKQLELIKWLVRYNENEARNLTIDCNNNEWYIGYYEDEICMTSGENADFAECLSEVFNNLWQDLTEQEKEEIKEILKWQTKTN